MNAKVILVLMCVATVALLLAAGADAKRHKGGKTTGGRSRGRGTGNTREDLDVRVERPSSRSTTSVEKPKEISKHDDPLKDKAEQAGPSKKASTTSDLDPPDQKPPSMLGKIAQDALPVIGIGGAMAAGDIAGNAVKGHMEGKQDDKNLAQKIAYDEKVRQEDKADRKEADAERKLVEAERWKADADLRRWEAEKKYAVATPPAVPSSSTPTPTTTTTMPTVLVATMSPLENSFQDSIYGWVAMFCVTIVPILLLCSCCAGIFYWKKTAKKGKYSKTSRPKSHCKGKRKHTCVSDSSEC